MKAVYQKSLEKTARQTALIQRTDTLIRLILRTVVNNIKVKHAGIFLYDKKRDEYVVKISRGYSGFKIPSGFVKIKKDNPLITYFTDKKLDFPKEVIQLDKINNWLRSLKVKNNPELKKFFKGLKNNICLWQAQICIPGFFRDDLIGVLFLGEKKNRKKFIDEEMGFLSALSANMVMAIKNTWLVEDLNSQLERNKRLFLQTVSALASSIEAKDKYTVGHTERVMNYSLDIVDNLKKDKRVSNRDNFKEEVRISALLHDIGKIGIPEQVLNKEDRLTDEEWENIKKHPLTGVNILNHIEEFQEILQGVKYHHERYDGSGYPCGLKGEEIPLIAAIISIADAFDAMTAGRPYRKALSKEEAVLEIKRNKGKQFSPSVVEAFLKAFGE
jgi:HD-GYP domain-containing protein (c-di-GMP phosphodiesterase class II)